MPQAPSNLVIRQAAANDISIITEFIDTAFLVHRNLDWRPLMEWVEQPPFLLRFTNHKLTALLSCAADPEGIAWIHAFIMDQWSGQVNTIWLSLFDPAMATLAETRNKVFSVSLSDWYTRLLKSSGFTLFQNIVVLQWGRVMPPSKNIPPEVFIRPMEPTDLDQVAEVDRQTFEAAWVISRTSLQSAYLKSSHASVAEINDRIIGYELSTANHLSSHLTRLAVLPEFTHQNLGYTLATQMLEYFARRGIWQITVNTQDNNHASLSLYRKLGFFLTSDSFPVFAYSG